ncbi:MAG: transcription termination/antitermination protein NusG [Bacteroidales bacterium]
MTELKHRWYVLRSVGGKEKKVKESIENEMNGGELAGYVSQVLIPMEKIYQIRNGKKVSKDRSFFPGYVLVEASLVGEVSHILKNINNVIGFLGETKGGDPMPLRESEVNRILGRVDELAEADELMNIPFVIGETIKVIDGAFNGFNGTIEEIHEDKKKLKVMVKIFGRKTPLELSFMQVERV